MTEKKGMKRIDLGPTGERVAEQIARLRGEKNLTYAALEKRLEEGGHKIPALGLRRIEAKARHVSVDDLTAIAVALDVSPLTLLLPNHGGEDPEKVSGLKGAAGSNVLWLWGLCQEPLSLPAEPTLESDDNPQNARAIQLFRIMARPEILSRSSFVPGVFREPGESEEAYRARRAAANAEKAITQNPQVGWQND